MLVKEGSTDGELSGLQVSWLSVFQCILDKACQHNGIAPCKPLSSFLKDGRNGGLSQKLEHLHGLEAQSQPPQALPNLLAAHVKEQRISSWSCDLSDKVSLGPSCLELVTLSREQVLTMALVQSCARMEGAAVSMLEGAYVIVQSREGVPLAAMEAYKGDCNVPGWHCLYQLRRLRSIVVDEDEQGVYWDDPKAIRIFIDDPDHKEPLPLTWICPLSFSEIAAHSAADVHDLAAELAYRTHATSDHLPTALDVVNVTIQLRYYRAVIPYLLLLWQLYKEVKVTWKLEGYHWAAESTEGGLCDAIFQHLNLVIDIRQQIHQSLNSSDLLDELHRDLEPRLHPYDLVLHQQAANFWAAYLKLQPVNQSPSFVHAVPTLEEPLPPPTTLSATSSLTSAPDRDLTPEAIPGSFPHTSGSQVRALDQDVTPEIVPGSLLLKETAEIDQKVLSQLEWTLKNLAGELNLCPHVEPGSSEMPHLVTSLDPATLLTESQFGVHTHHLDSSIRPSCSKDLQYVAPVSTAILAENQSVLRTLQPFLDQLSAPANTETIPQPEVSSDLTMDLQCGVPVNTAMFMENQSLHTTRLPFLDQCWASSNTETRPQPQVSSDLTMDLQFGDPVNTAMLTENQSLLTARKPFLDECAAPANTETIPQPEVSSDLTMDLQCRAHIDTAMLSENPCVLSTRLPFLDQCSAPSHTETTPQPQALSDRTMDEVGRQAHALFDPLTIPQPQDSCKETQPSHLQVAPNSLTSSSRGLIAFPSLALKSSNQDSQVLSHAIGDTNEPAGLLSTHYACLPDPPSVHDLPEVPPHLLPDDHAEQTGPLPLTLVVPELEAITGGREYVPGGMMLQVHTGEPFRVAIVQYGGVKYIVQCNRESGSMSNGVTAMADYPAKSDDVLQAGAEVSHGLRSLEINQEADLSRKRSHEELEDAPRKPVKRLSLRPDVLLSRKADRRPSKSPHDPPDCVPDLRSDHSSAKGKPTTAAEYFELADRVDTPAWMVPKEGLDGQVARMLWMYLSCTTGYQAAQLDDTERECELLKYLGCRSSIGVLYVRCQTWLYAGLRDKSNSIKVRRRLKFGDQAFTSLWKPGEVRAKTLEEESREGSPKLEKSFQEAARSGERSKDKEGSQEPARSGKRSKDKESSREPARSGERSKKDKESSQEPAKVGERSEKDKERSPEATRSRSRSGSGAKSDRDFKKSAHSGEKRSRKEERGKFRSKRLREDEEDHQKESGPPLTEVSPAPSEPPTPELSDGKRRYVVPDPQKRAAITKAWHTPQDTTDHITSTENSKDVLDLASRSKLMAAVGDLSARSDQTEGARDHAKRSTAVQRTFSAADPAKEQVAVAAPLSFKVAKKSDVKTLPLRHPESAGRSTTQPRSGRRDSNSGSLLQDLFESPVFGPMPEEQTEPGDGCGSAPVYGSDGAAAVRGGNIILGKDGTNYAGGYGSFATDRTGSAAVDGNGSAPADRYGSAASNGYGITVPDKFGRDDSYAAYRYGSAATDGHGSTVPNDYSTSIASDKYGVGAPDSYDSAVLDRLGTAASNGTGSTAPNDCRPHNSSLPAPPFKTSLLPPPPLLPDSNLMGARQPYSSLLVSVPSNEPAECTPSRPRSRSRREAARGETSRRGAGSRSPEPERDTVAPEVHDRHRSDRLPDRPRSRRRSASPSDLDGRSKSRSDYRHYTRHDRSNNNLQNRNPHRPKDFSLEVFPTGSESPLDYKASPIKMPGPPLEGRPSRMRPRSPPFYHGGVRSPQSNESSPTELPGPPTEGRPSTVGPVSPSMHPGGVRSPQYNGSSPTKLPGTPIEGRPSRVRSIPPSMYQGDARFPHNTGTSPTNLPGHPKEGRPRETGDTLSLQQGEGARGSWSPSNPKHALVGDIARTSPQDMKSGGGEGAWGASINSPSCRRRRDQHPDSNPTSPEGLKTGGWDGDLGASRNSPSGRPRRVKFSDDMGSPVKRLSDDPVSPVMQPSNDTVSPIKWRFGSSKLAAKAAATAQAAQAVAPAAPSLPPDIREGLIKDLKRQVVPDEQDAKKLVKLSDIHVHELLQNEVNVQKPGELCAFLKSICEPEFAVRPVGNGILDIRRLHAG